MNALGADCLVKGVPRLSYLMERDLELSKAAKTRGKNFFQDCLGYYSRSHSQIDEICVQKNNRNAIPFGGERSHEYSVRDQSNGIYVLPQTNNLTSKVIRITVLQIGTPMKNNRHDKVSICSLSGFERGK